MYRPTCMQKLWWLSGFIILILTACVNTKKATYFNNIKEADYADVEVEAAIQKNDLLSIIVTSLNPEATEVFNKPNQSVIASTSGTGVTSVTTGYLVDQQGNIVFPILGSVKAESISLKQLADTLQTQLTRNKLLTDPIVNVRIMNFKVTVLGEVSRPSVVAVPNGKISLLEAIGMAGDLTVYAERNNVLLIRVENGKKMVRRINLNSPEFISKSPYYYLKTNDVVYVETNKSKIGSTSTLRQTLPAILSGLSFAAIIIDRLTR
jgi:polysaccharide export outer membrane protein